MTTITETELDRNATPMQRFAQFCEQAGRKPDVMRGVMADSGCSYTPGGMRVRRPLRWQIGHAKPCHVCGLPFAETEQAITLSELESDLGHRPQHVRCTDWSTRGMYAPAAQRSVRGCNSQATPATAAKRLRKLLEQKATGTAKQRHALRRFHLTFYAVPAWAQGNLSRLTRAHGDLHELRCEVAYAHDHCPQSPLRGAEVRP